MNYKFNQKSQNYLHPLYPLWRAFVFRNKNNMNESWLNFESWIDDIPPKPDKRYKLKRKDVSKIWDKENIFWKKYKWGKYEYRYKKRL